MKKNSKKNWKRFLLPELKEETRRWVWSILSFILALFFLMAYMDAAGPMGVFIKTTFIDWFGFGYFLFPFLLAGLGIMLLSALRPRFVATVLVGGGLCAASTLALLAVIEEHWGGAVGTFFASPFITLFDMLAAKIILFGIVLVSLLIFFDATPSKTIALLSSFFAGLRERLTRKNPETEKLQDAEQKKEELDEKEEREMPENKAATESDDGAERDVKENIVSRITKTITGGQGEKKIFKPPTFLKSKKYAPPPLSLLEEDKGKPGVGDIKANANIIKRTLQNFGISVEMDEVSVGPSFTRYALKPAQGIKLSRIVGLQNDLSLALAAHPLRIEAPIPGKSLVGIEIPNNKKTTVGLGSLLSAPQMRDADVPLAFPIGRNIAGDAVVGNLNKMPHLLIAGATGSGKSVTIHTIVTSLLYRNSPEHMRFIMIDPKRVELTLYNSIPHLLTPVITEPKKAILALKWAAKEMDRRYDILETEAVRDIGSYHKNIVEPAYATATADRPAYAERMRNERGTDAEEAEKEGEKLPELLPYIVIIIDELADIMNTYPRELESAIVRIAQMSRAVGIHLVLSTQRPQVNIITGLIKANVPARIALQVSSQTDSRTILDMGGAEKLLGAGDMLFMSGDMGKPARLQSAYIGEPEIKKVVKFLSSEYGDGEFGIDLSVGAVSKDALFEATIGDDFENEDDDALYEEAKNIVVRSKKASTTFLQRKLKIGYARAARIMDLLEERGVIGPGEGAKPREILVSPDTLGEASIYDVGDEDTEEEFEDNSDGADKHL